MAPTTVTAARVVPAAPTDVFDAWTDPVVLARWWWPHLAGTTYAVEPVVGGRYRIDGPAIGVRVTGVFEEVERPTRLAFTWTWEDGEPFGVVEDSVEVTFAAGDGGTSVLVGHTSVAHELEEDTERGWSDVLERLARLAAEGGLSR